MDEWLIKRAKKGDQESFTQLVLKVKDQAYRIAYCYLHNEEDSADAVCDAVEKAFRNIKKLKELKYFNTWFIRIVINECKLQLRGKEKVTGLADHLYLYDARSGNDEEMMDLQSHLKELPTLERALIYMKFYMGYTLDEIADIMEMAPGTVKTKIYGSLKQMKHKLEVRGV